MQFSISTKVLSGILSRVVGLTPPLAKIYTPDELAQSVPVAQ